MSEKQHDSPTDSEKSHPRKEGTYGKESLDFLKANLPAYLSAKEVFLFPSGNSYAGLCPIHDDTKPSFSVYGENHNRWKCFACDEGGDVFDLSIKLGLARTFPEAVREVAETLEVPLPSTRSGASSRRTTNNSRSGGSLKQRQATRVTSLTEDEEAFRWVTRHYLRVSFRSHSGEAEAISLDLGIPYALLKQAARGASGLGLVDGKLAYVYPHGVKVRNRTGENPRFIWKIGRAYAPWRFDRVVPDTSTIYLTEGESDALAVMAAGVEEDRRTVVVASPGISFPASWALLFADKHVIICFDFDVPGQKAAIKVADLLSDYAASVSIIKPLS